MIVALGSIHEYFSRTASGHAFFEFGFRHLGWRTASRSATAIRKIHGPRRCPSCRHLSARLPAHRQSAATNAGASPHSAGQRKSPHVLLLGAAVYTGALLDMHETYKQLPNFHEDDPLARPLLKLPAPLFYGTGVGLATGINLLGWKMEASPRWHKLWWIAQTTTIAGHFHRVGLHQGAFTRGPGSVQSRLSWESRVSRFASSTSRSVCAALKPSTSSNA